MTQHQAAPTAAEAEMPEAVAAFLRLSVILTGFEEHVLLGTGMLQAYYDELLLIIGDREAGALFGAFHSVGDGDDIQVKKFEKVVLKDKRYGPVARNVVMMWYLGAWLQLPPEWRDAYGATSYDADHVISAAAYREGLVWPAAGTHPMSAKAPGFGTWAEPSALPGPARTEPR